MELGRSPEDITLWEVVRAMEGPARPDLCVLGLQACSEETPCPLHHQWVPLRAEIQRLLDQTTLATLARQIRQRMELGETPWVSQKE